MASGAHWLVPGWAEPRLENEAEQILSTVLSTQALQAAAAKSLGTL